MGAYRRRASLQLLRKAVAALNSLKHGLRARAFRQTLHNAGYPTAKLDRIFYALVSALKPRNRLEFQRAARYVQMLWGIRQRWGEDQREKRRKVKTGFLLRLSKPERAFQTRIMKDMYRAWKGTTYRTRRRAAPVIKMISMTGWIPDAGEGRSKNDQRSWNVL